MLLCLSFVPMGVMTWWAGQWTTQAEMGLYGATGPVPYPWWYWSLAAVVALFITLSVFVTVKRPIL